MPNGHASMLLLGEGSEATEPYHKYDKIRPHSIRSLQFDQKVRPLSFRPEKFDLLTATRPVLSCFCFWFPTSWLGLVCRLPDCRILELKKYDKTIIVGMMESIKYASDMSPFPVVPSGPLGPLIISVSAMLLFLFSFPHLLGPPSFLFFCTILISHTSNFSSKFRHASG